MTKMSLETGQKIFKKIIHIKYIVVSELLLGHLSQSMTCLLIKLQSCKHDKEIIVV